MSSFVPSFIQHEFQAQQSSGRFFATVLHVEFSDIVPIMTQFLEKSAGGSKTLTDLMHELFAPLIDMVEAHDGYVANFSQVGFLAVFPDQAGRSEKESMWRGFSAAIHMQAGLGRVLFQYVDIRGGLDLKLVLANGLVEWGVLQPNHADRVSARYYFGGTAVRDCWRALPVTKPGTITLNSYVYQQLNSFLETDLIRPGLWRVTRLPSVPPAPAVPDPTVPNDDTVAKFQTKRLSHRLIETEMASVATVCLNLKESFTYTQINYFAQAIFQLQDRYRGYVYKILFNDQGAFFHITWGMLEQFDNDLRRAMNFLTDLGHLVKKPFRAAVTYGPAYVGAVGRGTVRELASYGQSVQLAYAMMEAADWGEIWVDETGYQRIADQFKLEPLGRYSFQSAGIAVPQRVYSVMGVHPAYDRQGSRYLVGRQQELTELLDFVVPIFHGRFAGVMTIWGDAGLGKSYLVNTLDKHLQFHPLASQPETTSPVLLRFQGDEFAPQPLTPIRQLLRRYFNVSPSYSPGINERHFDSVWQFMLEVADVSLRKELERTHPFTAALVNLAIHNDVLEHVDGSLQLQNITAALITVIKARAVIQPVLLHIEDAQWLDSESRQILSELANHFHLQTKGHPVAILVSSRTDAPATHSLLEQFAAGFPQESLQLSLLLRHDIERLAEYLLEGRIAPSFLDQLQKHTDGNPLFVEQLLLYLRDNLALTHSAHGLAIANHFVEEMILPASIHATLIARLERLSPGMREVVQFAAVIGGQFSMSVLIAVLGAERGPLMLHVDVGIESGLWYPAGEDNETYRFAHILLHEAAYQMQFSDVRQLRHGRVAQTLEELYALNLSRHYGALAHHYQKSCDRQKERFFSLLAGDEAVKQFANQTAVQYYTRAIDLTSESTPEMRYIILQKREIVYSNQGQRALQIADLAAMVDLVNRLRDDTADDQIRQAELDLRYARYSAAIHEHREAVTYAQAVIRRAHATQNRALQIEGYLILAESLYQLKRYTESEDGLQQCLMLVQNSERKGDVFAILADIASERGQQQVAEEYYQQALFFKKDSQDPYGEAQTLFRYSLYQQQYGDYSVAIAAQEQALTIFQALGDRTAETLCYLQHGLSCYSVGYYNQARDDYAEAFRLSCEIQEPRLVGLTLAFQGLLSHGLSNHTVAEVQATQAQIIGEEDEDSFLMGLANLVLGNVLLAQDSADMADAAFQQSLQAFHDWGDVRYAIQALSGLARVRFYIGDNEQALSCAEQIMQRLHDDEEINQHRAAPKLYLSCYRILNALRDKRRRPVLKKGYAILQLQAEQITDIKMRQTFLQSVPAHREIRAAYVTVFE